MQKISLVNLSDKYLVDMATQLGKGSTGSVYSGKDLRSGEKVAVKIIELSTIDNEVTQYLLEMEKKALLAINSPYVLKGHKIWQDHKFCFMVTEYCNGGTLKNYIQKKGKLDEEKSLALVRNILEGYQHLVKKGMVHRDLKPANIMIHEDSPKIIDFGYCEIEGYSKPSLEYNVGSPSYMAPESFDLNIYNEKTQIWAIGVILFECVTGRTIDQGRKMTEAYKEIEQTGVPYPAHVSDRVRKVVDWCLSLSPRKRPTCQELLNYFNTSSRDCEKSLFKDITNSNLLKIRNSYNEHNNYENRPYEPFSDYGSQLFRSSKASTQIEPQVQFNQPKYVPRKYVENRVRPSYSNYVKPISTNLLAQQPEVSNYRGEHTERPSSKILGHKWDSGVKAPQSNYNNCVYSAKTGREYGRGVKMLGGREKGRVESQHLRAYRN